MVGGCAAVSPEAAAAMLRPIELIEIGTRVGAAAAAEVADLPALAGVRLPGGASLPARFGDAKEALAGSRPTDPGTPSLPAEARGIPVLGEFDVVVIGGGTGGAPAGIGAGRAGARTLLLESLHGLGGISTLGLIGSYYYGYREGFTKELDQGLAAMDAAVPVVGKSEWYRQQNRAAGTEVWYGALGCGAFVRGADVRGVVVATPQGRGVVLAKVVVDSTGNADVAAAAGAACSTTGGEHVGVQGAGLPPLALGASYTNTDFTFIDDTDITDLWHAFFWAREKFAGSYDLVQITDTRERRRIVGDFTMTPMDILNGRRYPDTVVCAYSNFDSHGFTVHPYFLLTPPDSTGIYVDVPYRCLLPEGLDGILVTGLGASAHRDAMPVIRMQPDVQNQGYAAGLAAAAAAAAGLGLRGVDVRALQQALVTKGNLPSRVLTDVDSYPYPAAQIQKAVDALTASPGILVDDADPAPAFQITGTWITSTSTSGYYGTGYKHNNQDLASTATFTPDLPAAGRYSVYLRWTANANRETAVPVTVQYSGGTAGLTVDQTANGGTWNLLGTWDFAAGTAGSVVLAAADGVGYVIADAVRFAPPTEVTVDDADPAPAFQTTGTWVTSTSTAGYYGAGYKHNNQDPASTATFTPDLPAAGSYDVYLRWTASTNRETAVPVTVHYDGGSASLTVNQTANGGTWNLLGTWSFAAGAAGSVVLAAADGVGYVIADAVRFVSQGAATMDPPAALAVVLTDPATAIPMLQAKHDDAGTHPDGRLAAAHILGMLGDATGAATLAGKVASYPAWDAGWDYTGMGQYGRSLSELDSYVIALGRTQAAGTALAPLLDKLALLDAAQAFSHHRAVAMALEALGDPSAAAPLAALLAKPAMTGYHVTSMAEARAQYGASATETVPRNNSLRELHIARALYRCGDSGGAGAAILALYAQDLRGHYSRHARAVLAGN